MAFKRIFRLARDRKAASSFSRYAYNVTFQELSHAVTKTFLESMFSGLDTYQQNVLKDMKKVN